MADRLESGEVLHVGESLVSHNRRFRLALQFDGNLVLYKSGRARWATHTGDPLVTQMVMQTDGNFVVLGDGGPIWATNTAGNPGAFLIVQNDGNVVLYATDGRALFSSDTVFDRLYAGESLMPGEHLFSENRRFVLALQSDGNLVLYKNGRARWATHTGGPVMRAVLREDGNFLVEGNGVLWETNTAGHPNAVLVVQNDGNVVLYADDGRALFSSDTTFDRLYAGESLRPGEHLFSQNRQFILAMQLDGNLVLYRNGHPRWATGTAGAISQAVLQDDGNFVLYAPDGPVWATGTVGNAGSVLVVQNDGNVVLYGGDGRATFSSDTTFDRLYPGESLAPGGFLFSEDRHFLLVLERDGNLVLYKHGQPRWSTDTGGKSTRMAIMQTDGNFVLYDESGAIWETGTSGAGGALLLLQNDGNLVVYGSDSAPRWASDTGTHRVFVPRFRPSTSGFRFGNGFPPGTPHQTIDVLGKPVVIGDANRGLCGGMVYAARDYWQEHRTPPPDIRTAPVSGPLYEFLVARLYDSFSLPLGPLRYIDLMDPTLPDDQPISASIPFTRHGRSWVMAMDEWPRIRGDIDSGVPSPIALVTQKTTDVSMMGHNHQVLAYGYDLDGTLLRIYVYDPNANAKNDAFLELGIDDPRQAISVRYNVPVSGGTVWCFFRTEYEYRPAP